MRFLRSRLVHFSLILLVVLVSLNACRTKEPGPVQETYEGVELTYYKMFDDEDAIEPIIQAYEATHPGLKIRYRKFVDFEEYQKVILNELAEGEGPDIFSMQNTWFTSNYKKLTPMPQAFGTPDDFADTFVDVAFDDLVRTDDDGTLGVYAVPMTVDTLALYYNKDHFEDRVASRGKPAETWEGIKEDVVLLNKEDNSFDRFEVSGIAMGRADNISRAVDILYLLFLQHDIPFYDENLSEAVFAKGIGNNPAVEAVDLFTSFADPAQKFYSWNEFSADAESDAEEVEAFASGKVSMIIGYSFTYDQIMDQIDLLNEKGIKTIDKSAVRVSEVPQLYDPDVSSDKRTTYASYFAETVSRTSENPELAWDFLIFLTMKDNLQTYFDETKKPTSRRDMIADQKKDPIYGIFAEQIGFAESFPIVDYYGYKGIFEQLIESANLNGASRGIITDAQDEIDTYLPEEGLLVPEKETEEEEPAE